MKKRKEKKQAKNEQKIKGKGKTKDEKLNNISDFHSAVRIKREKRPKHEGKIMTQRRMSFSGSITKPPHRKRSKFSMLTNEEVRDLCDDFSELEDEEINEIRTMFFMFDIDGDGSIDLDELEFALSSLKLQSANEPNITPPQDDTFGDIVKKKDDHRPTNDEGKPKEEEEEELHKKLMRYADHNGSGNILFGEFVGLCVDMKHTQPISKTNFDVSAQELFDIFGGELRLTIDEMQEKLKLITGERHTKESIVNMLNAVDENNDGVISIEEFSKIVKFGEKSKKDMYFHIY